MQTVRFWNGNKTCARQDYELALLDACLRVTQEQEGLYSLLADNTDYPDPEDEGNVFECACDVLVTVAGNVKFTNKQKIVIKQPLAKGLLGHRLLIVRNESLPMFQSLKTLKELQTLSIGIPATWADAELFRQNDFKVVERGTREDIFIRLQNKEFDFIALGANEIEDVFAQYVEALKDMSIEASLMIYYPFPLVFYVNPENPDLAKRLETGLSALMQNGQYDRLFRAHHGDVVERLNLKRRKIFSLHNALLPTDMSTISASLLD
jgi:hypothetical protein